MSTINKNNRRRYYLHFVLKHKYGAVVKARKRLVYINWEDSTNPKVKELLFKHQYIIQTEIR